MLSSGKCSLRTSITDINPDVNDDTSVKEAIHIIESEQGRINVLVNNAGYVLLGPVEQTSINEFKAQFETNFFGAIRGKLRSLSMHNIRIEGDLTNSITPKA
jgi:NAD(P)-dependent dehydrogenase (short-subunit alcohol dehydrogenase family)